MNFEQKLHWQMCKRSAHNFIFGIDTTSGEHIQFVYTKDEHRQTDAKQPFPDKPYLRALVDLFSLGARLMTPDDAEYALAWGFKPRQLHQVYETSLMAVEKSRQVMVTWLCLAYVLWRAKFFEYQLIMVQSKREADAEKLVCSKADNPDSARLSFMEINLPEYMQSSRTMTKCNIHFDSGSHVWGIPQGGSLIRSHTPSLLFSDEAAFQPEFGDAYTAALPAVRGGGQAIFVSSAELGDFYELVEAE
jgi:hypothetical protein